MHRDEWENRSGPKTPPRHNQPTSRFFYKLVTRRTEQVGQDEEHGQPCESEMIGQRDQRCDHDGDLYQVETVGNLAQIDEESMRQETLDHVAPYRKSQNQDSGHPRQEIGQ